VENKMSTYNNPIQHASSSATQQISSTTLSNITESCKSIRNVLSDDFTSILIAMIVVIITVIFIHRRRKSKFGYSFSDFRKKELDHIDEPETILQYLEIVLSKHWLAYILLVFLPIISSLILQKTTFALLALWGFLITTLSAFYAHRADCSSYKAKSAADRALKEAINTRNAVIHFADSLDMFVSKVRQELLDHKAKKDSISIKFLTVNPAFGHVGLENNSQSQNSDQPFHDFLFEVVNYSNWNIEMLTHNGLQAKDWLCNIVSATDASASDIDTKINELYATQKLYIEKLANDLAASKRLIKFWNPSKLPNINNLYSSQEDIDRIKIPFQFFIIKSPIDPFKKNGEDADKKITIKSEPLKVFFLFSGDFLYDFVFKILPDKDREGMNMKKLSALTKGYYSDDKELVKIFDDIFSVFSKNMPELKQWKADEFYP
jgi:preprotein translocase subunit SecG